MLDCSVCSVSHNVTTDCGSLLSIGLFLCSVIRMKICTFLYHLVSICLISVGNQVGTILLRWIFRARLLLTANKMQMHKEKHPFSFYSSFSVNFPPVTRMHWNGEEYTEAGIKAAVAVSSFHSGLQSGSSTPCSFPPLQTNRVVLYSLCNASVLSCKSCLRSSYHTSVSQADLINTNKRGYLSAELTGAAVRIQPRLNKPLVMM